MFQTDVDIVGRALQLCGLPRLDPTLGFSEQSQRATETQFAYGKVKRAELQGRVWTKATRTAVIRPIDSNTMILQPALWTANTTYFAGSVVADANGFAWISKIANNTFQPGSSTAWDPYFGPLTVSQYDSTQAYFAGEVVYEAPGDGTYNVYQSQVSGNLLDPSLSNLWSSATTYNQNNVVVVYPAWSSGTTYSKGQTVTYTDGNTYSSLINSNTNHIPANTINTDWALMPDLQIIAGQISTSQTFNTLAPYGQTSPIIAYYAGTTYAIGSYVTFAGNLYVSLANANTGNTPNASGSSSWVVVSNGTLYMSLINLNTNNNPSNTPATWAVGTTYSIGNVVAASDGVNYTSLINSNTGNNPAGGINPTDWSAGSLTAWTSTFTQGGGNQQWLQIGGASFPAGVGLTTPNINWPIGAGPYEQTETRNVYRLPSGFLRTAPQDPRSGAISWLGFPGNLIATDWTYAGNYLITSDGSPIPYRFVADITYVPDFGDMLCETLAYRTALAVVEILTQSSEKKLTIEKEYKKFKSEAGMVDAIETGPVSAQLDDLIACRV
jgi:hypothetical protein